MAGWCVCVCVYYSRMKLLALLYKYMKSTAKMDLKSLESILYNNLVVEEYI